jgi:hypothetical protein
MDLLAHLTGIREALLVDLDDITRMADKKSPSISIFSACLLLVITGYAGPNIAWKMQLRVKLPTQLYVMYMFYSSPEV